MSNGDHLFGALRDAARAEEKDALADARWDALARGELTAEERAELDGLAGEDPALQGAPEVLAPLGPEAEARFLSAIQGELAKGKAAPAANNVVSLAARQKARSRWAAGSAVLALAAGAALWLATRPGGDGPLPEYALLVTGGERSVRADDPRDVVLSPGARVTMTLRPAEPAGGALEAQAFLSQGGAEIALEASVEVSADGAVRMVGRVPAGAALAAGEAEVVAAIGRQGALAGSPATIAELSKRGGVRVVRKPVTWRP
jgi:hypothetical protein